MPGMNTIGHTTPGLSLFNIADPRLEGVTLSILLIGVQPFCNDQTKAAFCESLVVTRHLSGRQARLGSTDTSHGCYGKAISQSEAANIILS